MPETSQTSFKESWVFLKLFEIMKKLISDRWFDEVNSTPSERGEIDGSKLSNMIRKMEHLYTFMLNAEHHCRLDKYPFPGVPDDGNFSLFDDIWLGIQKNGNDYPTRIQILEGGFQRYINLFYYRSPVS